MNTKAVFLVFSALVATASAVTAAAPAATKTKQPFWDTMTITAAVIFGLQLMFCAALCSHTRRRLQAAAAKKHQQEGEFYEFLYQFHKQMADEEQAMKALAKQSE
jgi:hypothetical protein|tara:strand:+ start:129 stop:443 length:315 start_codon:yes stop_codon:yes gene_type:complete